MHNSKTNTRTRFLLTAAGACIALGAPALAQDGAPAAFSLSSVVRDFTPDHPDFQPGMAPTELVSGNVAFELGSVGVPEYSGAGQRLGLEAYDDNRREIAPHLARSGAEGVFLLEEAPTMLNKAVLDFWDPATGAYKDTGSGDGYTQPVVVSELSADVPEPTYDQVLGSLVLNGHGNTVIDRNLDLGMFFIETHRDVEIQGDVTIRVRGDFVMMNQAHITIADGSSLTLIVDGTMTVMDRCSINLDSWDPERFSLYMTGAFPLSLVNQTEMVGQIYAPDAQLLISDGSELYGAVEASTLDIMNQGGVHVMGSNHESWCGRGPDVTSIPVQANDGGVTSESTFATWFRDQPGRNASANRSVRFADNDGDGVYEFYDDDYTPIDNALYLNDASDHNRYFTTTIEATAEYNACGGEFFEIRSDAEAWVFINDDLVIDLGSSSSGREQRIDLDRLDLNDGEQYTIRFFYAQRGSSASSLGIRTNVMPTGGAANVMAASPYYD